MPFTLIKPGLSGVKSGAAPHYFVRKEQEQAVFLGKFLALIENRAEEYYTEDPEAGREYLEKERGDISIQDALEHGSDKVLALIELAKEENMQPQKILDIMMDSIVPEPGPDQVIMENLLYSVPIGDLRIDINQFNGFINREPAENLYKKLAEGFDEDRLEKIYDKTLNISVIEDEHMLVEFPVAYGWHAVIDEDIFKDKMIDALEVAIEDAEERKPAVAHLKSVLVSLV